MYTEGLKVPVGANQFLCLAEPSETSTGHLTGSRPVVADGEGLMTQYKEGGRVILLWHFLVKLRKWATGIQDTGHCCS